MNIQIKKNPFLVVSSSPYMRGIIKFVIETIHHAEVQELESEERALLFLRNLESFPSMIIYDYTPNAYLIEDFITYLKDHSKKVKIIILVDKVREEGRELLKNQQTMSLMDELSIPTALIQESEKTFNDGYALNQDEYCRVHLDFLSILDGINKDLFLKISNQKFVKIFNEDDATDSLDLKKYQDKGIDYLYLKRETANWVILQIQNQIGVFLKANNFKFILRGASDTPEKRFEKKILRIHEEVHIDKDFKEVIDKAIEKIKSVVDKEARSKNLLKIIKEDFSNSNSFFSQKIKLSSLVACTLARELDWISKTTIDKLIYACVLCDITLIAKPHLLRIEGIKEFEKIKDQFSSEDQKIFLSHPQDAAHLINLYFNMAPPDTDILALQHHELPDGSGFPLNLRGDKVSPLSALFIIATDFTYYYLKDDEPILDDYLLKRVNRYEHINFRKVFKALEKIKKIKKTN